MAGEQPSSALELTLKQRSLLGGLGGCAFAAAAAVVFFKDNLDVTSTALIVVGGILMLLAILGRLPKSFEVAGLSLDYNIDKLADALGTIKSSDLDDESKKKIVELLEQSASDSHAYRQAQNVMEKSHSAEKTVGVSEGRAGSTNAERADDATVEDLLMTVASDGKVEEDYVVLDSGVGKQPKFEYFIRLSGTGVVIDTIKYWNPSTLELLRRRLERSFRKATSVSAAILLTPEAAIDAVQASLEDMPVLVVSEDVFKRYVLDGSLPEKITDLVKRRAL